MFMNSFCYNEKYKNVRKIAVLLFTTLMCMGITACSQTLDYPYYEMPQEHMGQSMFITTPSSVTELESYSDLIVQGEVQGNGETIDLTKGEFPIRATYSTLKVTKVFKGNVKAGEEIGLCEGYYLKEEDGETVLCLMKNYMPSAQNSEYVFFLVGYSPESDLYGSYSPIVHEMGRYPLINNKTRASLDVDTMPVEELYIASDDQDYRNLYKEVIQAYMK